MPRGSESVATQERFGLRTLSPYVAIPVVATAVYPLFVNDFWLYIGGSTLLVAAAATSLNLAVGYVGVLSVGQSAFLSIGAFTAGLAAAEAGLPFVVVLVLATMVAGVIGVGVALVSLRWRGVYVILGTLALNFVVLYVTARIQENQVGPTGFVMPTADIAWIRINSDLRWYYALAIFAALNIACVARLVNSHLGRAWAAGRANPEAASALGVNVRRHALMGLTISSALVGTAGALSAFFTTRVTSETFSLAVSIQYLSIVLIGGVATLTGGLLGAIFYSALPHVVEWAVGYAPTSWVWLRDNTFAVQNGLFGIAIVAVLVLEPRGLVHIGSTVARRGVRLVRRHPRAERRPASGPRIVRRAQEPVTAAGDLALRDVSVVYKGTVRAVDGVDIDVHAGEIVGLLGANGAGKTSLLRAITGFLRFEHARVSGRIEFSGRSIGSLPPYRVARRGISLVPERDKVFPDLTVAENLRLVRHRASELEGLFPALAARSGERAGFLSGGERQMLALARALLTRPRLLLVDELSQGLAPRVLADIQESLGSALQGGDVAVLMVDQNPDVILGLAHRIYVLESGRVTFAGDVDSFRARTDLSTLYFRGAGLTTTR